MKLSRTLLLGLAAITAAAAGIATVAYAKAIPDLRAIDLYAERLIIPTASGTQISALRHGQLSLASGDSSGALTLTGVTTSSRIIATVSSGNSSSRSLLKAVPTADTVTVTLSGTAGSATTVDILAIN